MRSFSGGNLALPLLFQSGRSSWASFTQKNVTFVRKVNMFGTNVEKGSCTAEVLLERLGQFLSC